MPRPFLSSPERRRKETTKKYREKNKQKLKEYNDKYFKSAPGIKTYTINNWKRRGVIGDYDKLYEYHLSVNECENCGIELNQDQSTKKCLDHDHTTGLFRNILCQNCNLLRG